MAIKKQEFYEGAALHQLACGASAVTIRLESPFFVLNDRSLLLLKYSTKNRTPWAFTFSASEQALLAQRAATTTIFIGLICGADGVAAIDYQSFRTVARMKDGAIHIACYRRRGEHYEVCGPDGTVGRKVAPSKWRQLAQMSESYETP